MRKILLGTASALALSLVATSAMASGNDFWGQHYSRNNTDNTAVALGAQLNSVENDGSIVIGSQAETHATASSHKKSESEYSYGKKERESSESTHATYDHNDEGRVFNSNSIEGSFTGATGLINVNQNNGNNVSQDAQNTVAAIIGCDCSSNRGSSDNDAVAIGVQASYVSNEGRAKIVVDVATQSSEIKGSFNGATGLMNVNQNNGNNVSQKSQNTFAAIIGGSKH